MVPVGAVEAPHSINVGTSPTGRKTDLRHKLNVLKTVRTAALATYGDFIVGDRMDAYNLDPTELSPTDWLCTSEAQYIALPDESQNDMLAELRKLLGLTLKDVPEIAEAVTRQLHTLTLITGDLSYRGIEAYQPHSGTPTIHFRKIGTQGRSWAR